MVPSRSAMRARNDLQPTQGLGAGAIRDFDKAIELEPSLAKRFALGEQDMARQGKLELAIQDYDKAIALESNVFAYHQWRGDCYYRLGQWSKALADFELIVKLDPRDAWGEFDRALARRATGNLDGAIEDFDRGNPVPARSRSLPLRAGLALQASGISTRRRRFRQGYRAWPYSRRGLRSPCRVPRQAGRCQGGQGRSGPPGPTPVPAKPR